MATDRIHLIDFTELTLEARACSLAVIEGDFDEARFRASVVVAKALKLDQPDVVTPAAATVRALGPAGHPPGSGYGAHILAMARALDAIRPEGIDKENLPRSPMDDPDAR